MLCINFFVTYLPMEISHTAPTCTAKNVRATSRHSTRPRCGTLGIMGILCAPARKRLLPVAAVYLRAIQYSQHSSAAPSSIPQLNTHTTYCIEVRSVTVGALGHVVCVCTVGKLGCEELAFGSRLELENAREFWAAEGDALVPDPHLWRSLGSSSHEVTLHS